MIRHSTSGICLTKRKFDHYGFYRENSGFGSVTQRCKVVVVVNLSLMSALSPGMVALGSVCTILVYSIVFYFHLNSALSFACMTTGRLYEPRFFLCNKALFLLYKIVIGISICL